VGGYGPDSSCSEQGALQGSCEYGNDPSASIKGREFLEYPLKKESVPQSQFYMYEIKRTSLDVM
jgi:hypothetical protein